MQGLGNVSIIVPFGVGETAGSRLLEQLGALAPEAEVLVVGPCRPDFALRQARWVESLAGRARQLNAGAAASTRPYLWFLHADSELEEDCSRALCDAMMRHAEALIYFDLKFAPGSSRLMRVNQAGVWVRSRVLGMPFGDQGFCVARAVFEKLGAFPTDAPYGEDHLFAWRARQAGVPLVAARAAIRTSARKYERNGWLKTTIEHGVLAFKQAYPEWRKLMRSRGARL